MLVLRLFTIPLLAAALLMPAFGWQGSGVKRPRPNPPPPAPARQAPRNAPQAELFEKLMRMTPEEREQALSKLPPARRTQIEQRIGNFQKLAPAAQERQLGRLERLDNLPPKERNEVRRSMNQLKDLPDDRKKAINRELQYMTGMSDEERLSHMNGEEFRNRYSSDDQQMIGNLAKILPPKQ
jgi:hypothetical protein